MGWAFLSLLALVRLAMAQTTPCDPIRAMPLERSGREAFEKRQFALAARQLQEAFDSCPIERSLLLEISAAHAQGRQFDQAIQAARKFLEIEPGSVAGRLALANAYFMAQKFPEAREQADLALTVEPGQSNALKLNGNIAYLLGEFERSQDIFIGLLDRYPNDEEPPYMLGRIYYQEGRIEQAVGQFQRALKINASSYKAYDNLGLCYEALGETETAIRYFLTSIKLVEKDHPEYDWPYANLANLLLETGDTEKAFAAASMAAERNPYSARNFFLGGKALCKLEKTELCLNWLERSTALDPNYPEPLYLLANTYRRLGQEEKAKEARQKFIEAKAKQPGKRR